MAIEYRLSYTASNIDKKLGEIETLSREMETKQDQLTFDDTPTADSNNPVTSGGIYTALNTKQPAGDYALSREIPNVYSWALQEEKPTYTAAEVGAVTENYVDTKLSEMIDSAPETLDTLNKLSAALGDDANFAATVAAQIGNKVDKVEGMSLSSNDFTDEEKAKLASVTEGANNYVLPVANANTIGGVKSGTDITIDSNGNVSVNDDSHNHVISNIDGLQDALDAKQPVGDYALSSDIPFVHAWAKAETKPTYTAEEVGALPADTEIPNVSSHINTHNTATDSHSDIRLLVEGLTTRLNTLADSDDSTLDQMSEIVAYIKNNKSLIDSVTTSKINVTDIIDNLTTNVNNKPLSAAQGVVLKTLIDGLQAEVDGKSDSNHTHVISEISDLSVTATELNYMDGATDNIQTQLDGKLSTTGGTLTGELVVDGGSINIHGTAASHPLIVSNVTGSDSNGVVGPLYLQYGADDVIKLGNGGRYTISSDGSTYSGTAAKATSDANGNVIADTYATKAELVQPDLSQNDPEAADYVKGVIRQESLPEGYPYKTEAATELVTWDGNTDGLVTVNFSGITLCKISDNTLTEDELNGAIMRLSNGTDSVEMETVTMSVGGVVGFADSNSKYGAYIVYSDNYDLYGTVFPKAGIYWFNMASDGYYLTALSKVNTTINTISKDFLPTDFIVDIVPNESGDSYTANKTYDEIYKEVVSGRRVIARFYGSNDTFIGNAIEIPLVEMPGGNDNFPAIFYGVCKNRNSTEDIVKIIINDSDSIRVTFGSLPTISTATPGQTIVVKSVDDTGKPTEWEAVDMPEPVQSDLSVNDETNPAYIKGHTLDDAIALVANCGLVDISTDENGAILLDENNDILV